MVRVVDRDIIWKGILNIWGDILHYYIDLLLQYRDPVLLDVHVHLSIGDIHR